MSAASFLGIAGAVALTGFDGFFYSIGFLVAYLVVLYLVAEPLRNLGKYTFADMIAARFDAKKVRGFAAMNTVTISIFYMIAQLVGAGALIKLLLGTRIYNIGFNCWSVNDCLCYFRRDACNKLGTNY